jgi:hypothetical protein
MSKRFGVEKNSPDAFFLAGFLTAVWWVFLAAIALRAIGAL